MVSKANTLLVVISFFVWLAPAWFLYAATYKNIKKSGDTEGSDFILLGVVFASVTVTLKQLILFYEFSHLQIQSFILGNFLIFISYLILFTGTVRISKKLPRVPKHAFLYVTLLLSFIFCALFKKEPIVALDIFIYALTVSAVIASVATIYLAFGKEQKHTRIAISVFAISLLIDFFLKSTVEIWHIPNLQSVKLISFIIRFIALATLPYLWSSIVIKNNEQMEITEFNNATMNFLKRITVVAVLFSFSFSLFGYLGIHIVNNTIHANLDKYADSITLDISKTASNMQSALSKARIDLGKLAINPDVISCNEKGKEILKSYYISHNNEIETASRMDKKGIIIYTYPFTKNIGSDISHQPHVKKIMENHLPVASDPIIAVQGFPAVALHVPVFKEDMFDGSVDVLFNLKKLQQTVESKRYKDEKLVVADSNNRIVLAPEEEMLFKNISTVFPGNQNNTFAICQFGSGLVVKKTFYLMPVKTYTVYAFMPKFEVLRDVLYKTSILVLILSLFIFSFLYAIKALYNAFEVELKKIKEFAQIKYKETETLSSRLFSFVGLFSNIDINESVDIISQKLLTASLKIIENGNAGSILVKNGDKFVFVAVSKEYPDELKGRTLTSKEIVPSISKEPFIIKHIYTKMKNHAGKNFRNETRDTLERSNTPKIKSTIGAPFIVDDEYYGGIFIDNFQSENAFSKDDLKIAKAISNLASLVVKTKISVKSLQETESKLFYIIENFSLLNISSKEEEFFKTILDIGKKLISQVDAGSATLKKGNFYEYMAVFGYKETLKSLKLRVKTSLNIKVKKARVVNNIAKYNEEHLTPAEIEILRKADAFKTKQSIVSPIIVNGEYVGGIFLDSFKEGNVFTENDIKVATALSKLASIFVGAQLAYKNINNMTILDEASLHLFHRISVRSKKEDVLKAAYGTMRNIYKESIQEIAVWEKEENGLKLTKFDGKIISVLPISSKSFETVLATKRSTFIEKGTKKLGLSQAVVYSGVPDIPAFRIRFNNVHTFKEGEKKFIERFGREVITLYRSLAYHVQLKYTLINYIFSIGRAIGAYNPYTEWHSLRVGYLSMYIAEKIRLSAEKKTTLLFAASLHDVGKLGVPTEILQKPGKLTESEFEIIKRHPIEGEKIVAPINPDAAKIIRHHHERWNGTGYPDGLKGRQIPLLSRIITVADVFDALTTDRPYRKAFGFEKAMEIMISEKGKIFDPEIFDAFMALPKDILMKKRLTTEDIQEMQRVVIEQ